MTVPAKIRDAKSLDELVEAVAKLYEEHGEDTFSILDPAELPNFGGPRPEGDGAFSWDADRVLMGDTLNEATIVTREDWEAELEMRPSFDG